VCSIGGKKKVLRFLFLSAENIFLCFDRIISKRTDWLSMSKRNFDARVEALR
jgi:hypothetical protein